MKTKRAPEVKEFKRRKQNQDGRQRPISNSASKERCKPPTELLRNRKFPLRTTLPTGTKYFPLDPNKLKAIFKLSVKSDASNINAIKLFNITHVSKSEHSTQLSLPVPRRSGNVESRVDLKYAAKKEKKSFKKNTQPQLSLLLKEKAQNKLCAAKFRYLNEKLYTTTGAEARQFFQEDPKNFQVYHSGFQKQVEKWPSNPLDIIINELKEMPPDLVIADFGCGDAKIARSLPERTVHSFDLCALNKYVTVCDMAKVPLPTASVDVCIFCLSLMGTNLVEYIQEASRILKLGGLLKIAEVQSRFEDKDSLKKTMKVLGYHLKKEDWMHTMFTLMDFKKKKHGSKKRNLPHFELSPCLYKKR